MPEKKFRYVFGPVPSRRLGRSLGVDLIPAKTCSFDCLYCQLGHTRYKTAERSEYAPIDEVLGEIREKLAQGPRPDYITISGSGEPTLHTRLGELIRRIKQITDVPVAVITNGSMLWDPEVRRACAEADVVLPTLDAGDEQLFRRIHRPCSSLSLERVVEGLVAFRNEYRGEIWLEVFLLAGINAIPSEIEKLVPLIARIRPDKIQLNTAVRPPAERGAEAVPREELMRLCKLFGPKAEVIAEFKPSAKEPELHARGEEILDMLRRRPCTAEDVALGLGLHMQEAIKQLSFLLAEGSIEIESRGGHHYYKVKSP